MPKFKKRKQTYKVRMDPDIFKRLTFFKVVRGADNKEHFNFLRRITSQSG